MARTSITSGTASHSYRWLYTETHGPSDGASGEDREATTDQHRNMGCHRLHGTQGSIAQFSPDAPHEGRCSRMYLVPQARVSSSFKEQCHCPCVAAQDGCVESRGPILENTMGDICSMHGKKSKGTEKQMFANKPTNQKEVTWKRLRSSKV